MAKFQMPNSRHKSKFTHPHAHMPTIPHSHVHTRPGPCSEGRQEKRRDNAWCQDAVSLPPSRPHVHHKRRHYARELIQLRIQTSLVLCRPRLVLCLFCLKASVILQATVPSPNFRPSSPTMSNKFKPNANLVQTESKPNSNLCRKCFAWTQNKTSGTVASIKPQSLGDMSQTTDSVSQWKESHTTDSP